MAGRLPVYQLMISRERFDFKYIYSDVFLQHSLKRLLRSDESSAMLKLPNIAEFSNLGSYIEFINH